MAEVELFFVATLMVASYFIVAALGLREEGSEISAAAKCGYMVAAIAVIGALSFIPMEAYEMAEASAEMQENEAVDLADG